MTLNSTVAAHLPLRCLPVALVDLPPSYFMFYYFINFNNLVSTDLNSTLLFLQRLIMVPSEIFLHKSGKYFVKNVRVPGGKYQYQ